MRPELQKSRAGGWDPPEPCRKIREALCLAAGDTKHRCRRTDPDAAAIAAAPTRFFAGPAPPPPCAYVMTPHVRSRGAVPEGAHVQRARCCSSKAVCEFVFAQDGVLRMVASPRPRTFLFAL